MTLLERATRTHGAAGLAAGSIADAIVRTVAYSDVFDYAVTPAEVHRYLVGVRASRAQVDAVLAEPHDGLAGRVSLGGGFVTLAGREHLVERRRQRNADSAALWPRAVRYARAIGSLPFVRMVAVSGALASDNAVPGDDIDVFVVTEPGRLWLARAGAIGVVRLARLDGHEVCPNYLLADSHLELTDHDLYEASELARMVPVVGRRVYRRMQARNPWAATLLPNAWGPASGTRRSRPPASRRGQRLGERALRGRIGEGLERWERERKVRRFRVLAASVDPLNDPVVDADRCKGHFASHRHRIRDAYLARCRALGIEPLWEAPGAAAAMEEPT